MNRKPFSDYRDIPHFSEIMQNLKFLGKLVSEESGGDWILEYGFNPSGEFKRFLDNNPTPKEAILWGGK